MSYRADALIAARATCRRIHSDHKSMPEIEEITVSTGLSGFYADDKAAIKKGAKEDGFVYEGEPVTPGFTSIRMPGHSASVLLELSDGTVAVGDCAIAQYPGSGGRFDPIFADDMARLVREEIAPVLEGRDLTSFRDAAQEIDDLTADGKPLHPSVRYGASQAILDGVAKSNNELKAEVLAEEFDLSVADEPVGLNAQTGDQRYQNVDKMILKEVDMMPHGLFNSVEKVGERGEKLLEYAQWVVDRIDEIGRDSYEPSIRFDVYGTLGDAFETDIKQIAKYLVELEQTVAPYELIIEMPVSVENPDRQFSLFDELKDELDARDSDVQLMADEFANTLEEIREWVDRGSVDVIQVKTIDMGSLANVLKAVRYCEKNGVRAYQGGTCNETDVSARACVHVAMVAKPFAMASKPGMGVDEGIMIVNNEMKRILALTNGGNQ